MFKPFIVYEADKGSAGGSGEEDSGDKDQGTTSETLEFDSWIASQADPVKAMFDNHVKGLKSALNTEREIRETAEKNLRELAGKAGAGSDAQKKLTEMADQMLEADHRVDFYEEAHRTGVTNLKLAYLVAKQEELFDRKGRVDFEVLKKEYPELFGAKAKTPEGNAGNGTDDKIKAGGTMDDYIRRQAR